MLSCHCLGDQSTMTSSVDKQRLREEFEVAAGHVVDDDEIRLASPGVEGMVIFLESVTEGEAFGIEQIRHVFQEKKWAEAVDITWSDLEGLVDALIPSASKVENGSRMEMKSPALSFDGSLPSGEDNDRRHPSTLFTLIQPDELEAKDDQEAASQYLKLAKTIPHDRIEAFLSEELNKGFQREESVDRSSLGKDQWTSTVWKQKESEWNQKFYYVKLRLLIETISFQSKCFLHHWGEDDGFVSWIVPQNMKNEKQKQHALSINHNSQKPCFLK